MIFPIKVSADSFLPWHSGLSPYSNWLISIIFLLLPTPSVSLTSIPSYSTLSIYAPLPYPDLILTPALTGLWKTLFKIVIFSTPPDTSDPIATPDSP